MSAFAPALKFSNCLVSFDRPWRALLCSFPSWHFEHVDDMRYGDAGGKREINMPIEKPINDPGRGP